MVIEANLVDIRGKRIAPSRIEIEGSRISSISEIDEASGYILPGFIDAHIHIESSMVTPSAFAQVAVQHGTIATISDPHEIANVLGVEGVDYMVNDAASVPFKFFFGAPSCVPATSFETSGAVIDSKGVAELLERNEILYLSEMMNYPGVLQGDQEVMKKIKAAHDTGKPVDGHAPGLTGSQASTYIQAGISTDHECFLLEEALGKLQEGMKIIIREGSAARNYEALHPLIADHSSMLMFCSDDKHPDELLAGHINDIVRRSIELGYDLFDVLQIACLNPIEHYKLPVGSLLVGDYADFIVVKDLDSFEIECTTIHGEVVYADLVSKIDPPTPAIINNFSIEKISAQDLNCPAETGMLRVIEAKDGELVTGASLHKPKIEDGFVIPDPERDILKLAVVNRYEQQPPSIAFIRNIGIKNGAIASSVGHDSHNITAVGSSDEWIAQAINLVIESKGGISCASSDHNKVLPLPIAGLMSDQDVKTTGSSYEELDALAKALGANLGAPYMTLSFMALLVIPDLKLSDKGLFSGSTFEFVSLFVD